MITENDKPLRYQDDGNVHMDFHGATNATIDFVIDKFGVDALHQILFKVGKDVYRDIDAHIKSGDVAELVKHWRYYFDREDADYDIDINDDEIVLTLRKCPAYHHVKQIHPKVSPHFCDQTIKVNEAWAEGSPFTIDTEIVGEGSCRQVIRRRT